MNCKLNYIKENLEFITNAMNKGVPAMAIAKDLDIKYDTLKRNLNKLGVQVKTNQPRKGITKPEIRKTALEYLQNTFIKSSILCQKLIEDGIKEYKCEKCGRNEYEGVKIPLELHHINCHHYDNTLSNLMIVCPTCHAIIHRFINAEKNEEKKLSYKSQKKKVLIKHEKISKIPPKEELILSFKTLRSMTRVGIKYGVSDNAVRKWFKKYNLPFKSRELLKILD